MTHFVIDRDIVICYILHHV